MTQRPRGTQEVEERKRLLAGTTGKLDEIKNRLMRIKAETEGATKG